MVLVCGFERPYADPMGTVREARSSDIEQIHRLIVDLATYERAPDQVKATPDQLRAALFGPQPAAFALVAEVRETVVGFALYFRNFSTWEGVHGIYLEDLYVMPEYRGSGLGKAMLRSLAALTVERGYARLEWAVLDWNQPSIEFYRSLGAVPMEEWTVYRLSGPLWRRQPRPLGSRTPQRVGITQRQDVSCSCRPECRDPSSWRT